MAEDKAKQSLDWHLPEIAEKAEHQKLIKMFQEQEKSLNKNRLLYPSEEVGPVSQLNYANERRN